METPANRRFGGKVALVTGAASGIRLDAARRFAAEGARVVLADIDPQGAERAAAEIPDVLAVEVDIASERSVAAAMAALHVVFNNAGVEAARAPLHRTSRDDWRRVCAVNGDGAFYVLKHGIAALLESGGGAVVNTASRGRADGARGHLRLHVHQGGPDRPDALGGRWDARRRRVGREPRPQCPWVGGAGDEALDAP